MTEVTTYIREKHPNGHSIRKGSATHVTSATTAPPPVSSVAARGEWSLSSVLDIYWQFADPGDYYLGRCLAGLDPNHEDFATLPPHFPIANATKHPDIAMAMELMYGPILQNWKNTVHDPTIILLRCLASVIYHADWLVAMKSRCPGHQFERIPILSHPALLKRLQEMVTTKPSEVMRQPTGIPPHIGLTKKTHEVLEVVNEVLKSMRIQNEKFGEVVHDVIERRAVENGQLTADAVKGMIEGVKEKVLTLQEEVRDGLKALREAQQTGPQMMQPVAAPEDVMDMNDGSMFDPVMGEETVEGDEEGERVRYTGWVYVDGDATQLTLHHVPKNFKFPAGTKLEEGWKLWWKGLPNFRCLPNGQATETVLRPIMPFRRFTHRGLPTGVRNTYKLSWEPIYQMMEKTPDLGSPSTEVELKESFNLAWEYLRTRMGYVWENARKKNKCSDWFVSTWSRHSKWEHINKYGTATDKQNLPPRGPRNRAHTPTRNRRTSSADVGAVAGVNQVPEGSGRGGGGRGGGGRGGSGRGRSRAGRRMGGSGRGRNGGGRDQRRVAEGAMATTATRNNTRAHNTHRGPTRGRQQSSPEFAAAFAGVESGLGDRLFEGDREATAEVLADLRKQEANRRAMETAPTAGVDGSAVHHGPTMVGGTVTPVRTEI